MTMWKRTAPLLVILSIALNLAFIGVWAAHAAASRLSRGDVSYGPDAGGNGAMWCPLHRKLGATDQQWRQIEPKLTEFDALLEKTPAVKVEGKRVAVGV